MCQDIVLKNYITFLARLLCYILGLFHRNHRSTAAVERFLKTLLPCLFTAFISKAVIIYIYWPYGQQNQAGWVYPL